VIQNLKRKRYDRRCLSYLCRRHLRFLPQVAKSVNGDLLKGFTIPQVAHKHGWPESLVWSQLMVNAKDFDRFKALQCGFMTGDLEMDKQAALVKNFRHVRE
jgi:hypothetical protein